MKLHKNATKRHTHRDKLSYASLNVSFLIDENLENYREIHGWLTGLGFPRSHEQFETFINGKDRFPTSNATAKNRDGGRTEDVGFDVASYSDATLTILSSKNNPVLEVRFRDLYILHYLVYHMTNKQVIHHISQVMYLLVIISMNLQLWKCYNY